MKSRGFTLLEMLVATAVMGIAVVGLLSNISTSLGHGSRLTEHDRAALAAKRTMDELLLNPRLPYDSPFEGRFEAAATGMEGGWRAVLSRFEMPPQPGPGTPILERLELEVWWTSGRQKRTLSLEAYRRGMIPAQTDGGE
ncbi:MAG TPA: type II secretion system protein [Bryobacteraceae bacterium]|nr:type II secretion system protein [Bryobacteraceae bacterium]